jgi:CheY-like chemotaxis protein
MNKKKILVVDDEEIIRTLFNEALKMEGYEVHSAANADEALKILEEVKCRVMLLDLNLPGMNGIELCKEIRKNHPIAIIFAMTGFSSMFHLVDCREARFDNFFIKPVSVPTLLDEVAHAFRQIDRWVTK